MKFIMMLCAAVTLYAGNVSASVFAQKVSLLTSQLAQPGMWDMGAIDDKIRLEKDGIAYTSNTKIFLANYLAI